MNSLTKETMRRSSTNSKHSRLTTLSFDRTSQEQSKASLLSSIKLKLAISKSWGKSLIVSKQFAILSPDKYQAMSWHDTRSLSTLPKPLHECFKTVSQRCSNNSANNKNEDSHQSTTTEEASVKKRQIARDSAISLKNIPTLSTREVSSNSSSQHPFNEKSRRKRIVQLKTQRSQETSKTSLSAFSQRKTTSAASSKDYNSCARSSSKQWTKEARVR